ncbi:ferric reductase NAD binding domain-containing protein [Hirsutella rhossiliensis]|uniref:Ferric reductase NAD binding domain-containing protein n=1 Tax=Hirsutella rhossiliensis TaxID=111463 RepID=A0A9P8N382_9HYPO|nr:ferric reductase NAD binding domain-containing protein [Hirsutella rhossiliensis]KAH0967493.1 ferric reductase NAD binding domain-containing protein [Hirsutella rhossiliensis]
MAGSSGGSQAAFHALLARRAHYNEKLMLAFILSMLAIATGFALTHQLRRPGKRQGRSAQQDSKPGLVARLSRRGRNWALRSAWLLPSVGHVAVVGLYVAINLIIAFVRINRDTLPMVTNVASRAAWLALGNLVVVVVLALKNTPLAFLTAWSYERLNVLHQVAGYTMVSLVIIHASCYSAYFVQSGRVERLLHVQDIYGMVAGLSLLILGFAGAVIRRWWYELFYYVHVVFWVLSFVMIGLHQPDLGGKAIVVAIFVGAIWFLDRLLRLARLALYSTNNSVKLTPLPNQTTRVTLAKPPFGLVSGKHCFLWIPRVRPCEAHPFTVSSTDPLEFVVASHNGFTRDLHTYAVSHPGVPLKASVEGTYGTIPDATGYDTVVLVAGGSGASFTFGVALDLLSKLQRDESKHVVFIWAVKHSSDLDWFHDHLITLRADGRVSTMLFVTRELASQGPSSSNAEPQPSPSSLTQESELDPEKARTPSMQSRDSGFSVKSEKSMPSETETSATRVGHQRPANAHGVPITYERPNAGALVRAAIADTPASQRVLVLCCGPDELMTQVRNTTAQCIQPEGPGVELHCERFGW